MSGGSGAIFVTRPIALVFLIIPVCIFLTSFMPWLKRRFKLPGSKINHD